MRNKWQTLASVVTAIAAIACAASAQESRTNRVPTIEELYLSGVSPRLMSVAEQARSLDGDIKMQALADIERWISEGGLRDDEAPVQAVLIGLAHEGTRYDVMEERRLINYYPHVRRKAAQLLGQLGARTSDATVRDRSKFCLLDMLVFDDEVTVKAEAAYALGVIGNNDEGVVTEFLADSIRKQTQLAPDNNYAYAVALAIEKIADKNKDMRDFRAYTALVTIMQGNYTRDVKAKAYQVLQRIRGY